MFEIIARGVFWFLLAMVIAIMEIEIEGQYGWAERTNTFYRVTGKAAETWKKMQGGKPMTGYHIGTTIFALLIVHIPFVSGLNWSLAAELSMLAIYISWMVLWDYLWFLLNPHYGFKNFRRDTVWWHAKNPWFLGKVPMDYVSGWLTSLVLVFIASLISGNFEALINHIEILATFIVLIAVAIAWIAPYYMRWYKEMRESDDRNKTAIFHTLPLYPSQ